MFPQAEGRRYSTCSSSINPTFQVALLLGDYSTSVYCDALSLSDVTSTYQKHASVTSPLDLPLVSIQTFLEGVLVLLDSGQVGDSSSNDSALSSLQAP
jgi:hypothetical protein